MLEVTAERSSLQPLHKHLHLHHPHLQVTKYQGSPKEHRLRALGIWRRELLIWFWHEGFWRQKGGIFVPGLENWYGRTWRDEMEAIRKQERMGCAWRHTHSKGRMFVSALEISLFTWKDRVYNLTAIYKGVILTLSLLLYFFTPWSGRPGDPVTPYNGSSSGPRLDSCDRPIIDFVRFVENVVAKWRDSFLGENEGS